MPSTPAADPPAARFLSPDAVDAPSGSRAALHVALCRDGPAQLVENLSTGEALLAEVEGRVVPVIVSTHRWGDGAVLSPMRHFVLYPLEIVTAGRLPGVMRRGLSRLAEWMLAALRFDDVVHLNNRLAGSEPGLELSDHGWQSLIALARARFPRHAISVDGLFPEQSATRFAQLERCGALSFPARTVYVFDPHTPRQGKVWKGTRWKLQRSKRVWEDNFGRCETGPLTSKAESQQIAELFKAHRLGHSRLNTRYTARFFSLLAETEEIELTRWRDEKGRIDAFGICELRGEWIRFLHVATDARVAREKQLLDIVFSRPLTLSMETGRICNLGALNGAYKRHRGAVPKTEYQAIFIDHLPLGRRMLWRLIHAYRRWRLARDDGCSTEGRPH